MEQLTSKHLTPIVESEFMKNGFAGNHINSFNDLLNNGLHSIFTQGFKIGAKIINTRNITPEDKIIEYIEFAGSFSNIVIKNPTYYKDKVEIPLYPATALKYNLSYSSQICVNVELESWYKKKSEYGGGLSEKKVVMLSDIKIGDLPIQKNCIKCNLYDLPDETIKALGEDPSDPGGYFIIKGNEKAIITLENVTKNEPQIHKNITDKEFVRCEFLSQPGDGFQNSNQIKISLLSTGGILVTITLSKDKYIIMPFYSFYRVFDIIDDKSIINMIIPSDKSILGVDLDIYKLVCNAFDADYSGEYNSFKTITMPINIADKIKAQLGTGLIGETTYEDNTKKSKTAIKINIHKKSKNITIHQYTINDVFDKLDKHFFPHIGQTSEFRYEKLIMLSHLINRTLKVHFGALEPTDRDRATKSYYAAGPTIAKTIKTIVNTGIVQPANNLIVKAFKNSNYSSVNIGDIFIASIGSGNALEIGLEKSINSSTDKIVINTMEMKNRIEAHLLPRKNQISTINILRSIGTTVSNSNSKKSDRILLSRSVHPSFMLYIDPLQSVEGDGAGVIKQQSFESSITESFNSQYLKEQIRKLIIPLNGLNNSNYKSIKNLSKVFVNGHLLGYHNNWNEFSNKLRQMRRNGEIIPRKTSISVDTIYTGDINIWSSMGRLVAPLIIVYNNLEEFLESHKKNNNSSSENNKVEFKQWINYTHNHYEQLKHNEITIDDLIDQKIVEYISVQEIDNLYLCRDLKTFYSNKNNYLQQYTHLIVNQGVLGLTIMTTPFLDYSSPVRTTYQGNQRKQALGYSTLNYWNRFDKGTFVQFSTQQPLVTTMSNKYIRSDGCNAIVAVACEFDNQEDSNKGKKGTFAHGLYAGVYYTVMSTILEPGEEFKNPPSDTTDGTNKSFIHLDQGIVRKGTILKKGDVVIGKVFNNNKTGKKEDRSVIYNKKTSMKVDEVIMGFNSEDKKICKVRLSSYRPVEVGDKFSARSGNKAIISLLENDSNLFYCVEDGLIPDMIINPTGFPTRMVYNQDKESIYALWCIYSGNFYDATCFYETDEETIIKDLKEKYGVKVSGARYMMNGKTGDYLMSKIFICPTFYQRLEKMIQDYNNAVGNVEVNSISKQPRKGIGHDGALRIGEMEKDIFAAYGSSALLQEKMFTHSDGEKLYVCRNCGTYIPLNVNTGEFECKKCVQFADPATMDTCRMTKVLFDHLETTNSTITFDFEKPAFEYYYDK